MKLIVLKYGLGTILAASLTLTPCVNATPPLYEYAFDGNLLDSSGNNGPALTPVGGSVTGGQWRWTATNDRLTFDMSTSLASLKTTYTIEMLIKYDSVPGGWHRIIDFKNRVSDYGLYGYGSSFKIHPYTQQVSNVFTANVFSVVRIARNGATKEVVLSVDGTEVTLTDTNDYAAFSTNNMIFLKDNGSEDSPAGYLDYIKIWDTFNANDINPSAGGDPHFTTWSGKKYDFHGHCDLVLLHSESFGDDNGNRGLDIHIRSAPFRTVFSYVSDAAIRVGKDVLEVSGDGKHSINGVPQEIGSTEQVAGYNVTSSATKKGRRAYKIHLEDQTEIIVREYKGWLTLNLFKPTRKDFKGSVGLMGAYGTGEWVGRDGITIHTEIDEYGKDWRVQPDVDGILFQEPSPFPDRCNLPTQAQSEKFLRLGRRLGSANIGRDQALKACAHLRSEDMEDCVSDVQISGDLEMAQIYE